MIRTLASSVCLATVLACEAHSGTIPAPASSPAGGTVPPSQQACADAESYRRRADKEEGDVRRILLHMAELKAKSCDVASSQTRPNEGGGAQ